MAVPQQRLCLSGGEVTAKAMLGCRLMDYVHQNGHFMVVLRVSEMAAIKIKDINIKTGNLTLWQSKKSDTPELVHIPEQLIKSISQWTRENKLKPKDYLIRSQKGGSLSRIQIYRSIKDNARRIGITKKITTHSFRRSRATHLLDGGLPLEKVSRFLRHNRLESTMVYLKISINNLKKDIAKIDSEQTSQFILNLFYNVTKT